MKDVGERADVVVVGGGAAGNAAARTLRAQGFDGRVVLVHGEDGQPYLRTLVSKAIVQGLLTAEQAALPAPEGVEVVRGRAVGLHPARPGLVLDDGRELEAGALVLATGAMPRPAPAERGARPPARVGAAGAPRVVHLHTAQDADHLRALLGPAPSGRTVTVLGAGFVGSETAAWLADAGASVHLVARSRLPLARALGAAVAAAVARQQGDRVATYFGRRVEAVTEHRESVTVQLDDGTVLESDLAVVAHGTVPDAAWAGAQPDGVAVDDRLRVVATAGRYAAGAVALHTDRRGGAYRTDHWDAAVAQGAHVARVVLRDLVGAADPGPYVPDAGFSLSLHGIQVTGLGVPVPGAVEQHRRLDGGGVMTEFRLDGDLVAVTGVGATREVSALRPDLRRP